MCVFRIHRMAAPVHMNSCGFLICTGLGQEEKRNRRCAGRIGGRRAQEKVSWEKGRNKKNKGGTRGSGCWGKSGTIDHQKKIKNILQRCMCMFSYCQYQAWFGPSCSGE